jgi:predicted nucleic acid-binding protein
MCAIVDSCCLVSLLEQNDADHQEFKPILDWIIRGKGKLVYGGTKYKLELRRLNKLLPLLANFERSRKILHIDDTRVDDAERKIKRTVVDRNFNDQHLVAIVIVSGCKVVCTRDNLAISYLRDTSLLRRFNARRPSIYRSKRNKRLCCDLNVI